MTVEAKRSESQRKPKQLPTGAALPHIPQRRSDLFVGVHNTERARTRAS
jgi:hypothetical protein